MRRHIARNHPFQKFPTICIHDVYITEAIGEDTKRCAGAEIGTEGSVRWGRREAMGSEGEGGRGWRRSAEGESSCQRQRRSGMVPHLLVLALVVLLVCNRGGGNVVLCPTGSHRHSATVPIPTYVQQQRVALPSAWQASNADCQSRPPNAKSSHRLSHCISHKLTRAFEITV